MVDHLFTDSCDGHLYDTRDPSWHTHEPLRRNFRKHTRLIKSVADLKANLREGEYCWPGGYELFFVTSDGGVLCFDCAKNEFRNILWSIVNGAGDGWRVVAVGSTNMCEDTEACDQCGYVLYYDDLD